MPTTLCKGPKAHLEKETADRRQQAAGSRRACWEDEVVEGGLVT